MQKTKSELSSEAQVIKVETAPKANTANRVGGMLRNIIDSMQLSQFYTDASLFPVTGESATLYVDTTNKIIKIWDGTAYQTISGASSNSILAVGTGHESIKALNDTTVVASGGYSVALGESTTASAQSSMAINYDNIASGFSSFATGSTTQASGPNSISGGSETAASGNQSIAFGFITQASGDNSVALGNQNQAIGDNAVVIHQENVASGGNSLATGLITVASGASSISGGQETTASGENSVAFGITTQAIGVNAVALGSQTTAQGANSFAHGNGSLAEGVNSFVSGEGTYAKENNQVVVGKFNEQDTIAVFVVGNGIDDTLRKNAFTVRNNGAIVFGESIEFQPLVVDSITPSPPDARLNLMINGIEYYIALTTV